MNDGLSQATVQCIFQDSYGFLWVGTDDGLNRYDGYNFDVYHHDPSDTTTLSNNAILDIFEDSAGIIWIGTASGLNRYDRFRNEFKVYRYSSGQPQSISDNTITAIAPAGEDYLWIGTRNGLNLMDKAAETFRAFKSSGNQGDFSISNNRINDLEIDPQDRLWCATDVGLNVFDPSDSTFLTFNHLFDEPGSISHPVVNCLQIDSLGSVWVGTNAGISKVLPSLQVERVLEPVIPDFAGFTEPVQSMTLTDDQELWVGTNSALLRLDKEGSILKEYPTGKRIRESLSGGSILSLLEDESGAIWIGTYFGGLFRFSFQQQIFAHHHITTGNGNSNRGEVWRFFQTADSQWVVGGSNGLYEGDYGKVDLMPFEAINPSASNKLTAAVRDVIKYGDRYFVGTSSNGLFEFDDRWKLKRHYTVQADDALSITSNRIQSMLRDEDGIWIGTAGGGLNFFNPEAKIFRHWHYGGSRSSGLLDNNVTALTKDSRGNLWIGTANRGLSRLNGDRQTFEHFEHQSEDPGSISSNQINGLLVDSDNRLWVGTRGGGLNVRHPDSTNFDIFRTLHGLPANNVSGMVEDDSGVMWVSTNSGLVRVEYPQLDFRRFNAADGLRQLEFLPGAAGIMDNGEVWFGSTEGLVRVKSGEYIRRIFSPPVVFTEITTTAVEDGVQQEETFFPRPDEPLVYDYGINTVSIEFALLTLMQAEKNNYAYRIENMMDNWSDLGNQRKITLSNPEPGSYRVMVKGANQDGIWNENYSELELVIKPVIWQTAGFKFLIILLLSGGIYLFYRWRVSSMTSYNKMLERVVRSRTKEIVKERDEKAVLLKEIHHRVKNNLQIISSLLNIQSRLSGDPKVEELFLESTNRVQSMSMIHEKMYRSENLKEVNVNQYINELVTALVEAYNVNNSIEVDIEVNVDHFAVDTLTPLGLIINELVSNALKYAFKGRDKGLLFLRLESGEDSNFHLFIGDDGIGYTEADIREGAFGSELVEDLAMQLQGEIERVPVEKGTTFHLTFQDIDNH